MHTHKIKCVLLFTVSYQLAIPFGLYIQDFEEEHPPSPQIVYKVCDSIYEVLQPIYMSPPSEEDWKQIEHRFNTKWNFPNCIGSLDGKHIMMRCPPNSHSLYYNYKGFFFNCLDGPC